MADKEAERERERVSERERARESERETEKEGGGGGGEGSKGRRHACLAEVFEDCRLAYLFAMSAEFTANCNPIARPSTPIC